jgi:hypothetical protein
LFRFSPNPIQRYQQPCLLPCHLNTESSLHSLTNLICTGLAINSLIPSTYKVVAEAAGFQSFVVNEDPLQAKREAGLNITLQLGTSSQTVDVSSQVQTVDPTNATLGGVVNNKSIVDLPIVNRNVLTLMAIEPGVQPSTQNNYSSNFFTSAIRYSFNGGLESTSDFQQDGISILNQSDIPGIMGLTMLPSVDAVD